MCFTWLVINALGGGHTHAHAHTPKHILMHKHIRFHESRHACNSYNLILKTLLKSWISLCSHTYIHSIVRGKQGHISKHTCTYIHTVMQADVNTHIILFTCTLIDASYNLWVSLMSAATFIITLWALHRLVNPWKLGVKCLVIFCNNIREILQNDCLMRKCQLMSPQIDTYLFGEPEFSGNPHCKQKWILILLVWWRVREITCSQNKFQKFKNEVGIKLIS